MGKVELTIGALAGATGVHIETIRYYERIGLLAPPPRSAGGHRLYGIDAVARLRFVRRARALGFSLAEVRALAALDEGGASCGEVKVMAERHLEAIRAKIDDLARLEATLAGAAARCRGGRAPRCPVIDTLNGESRPVACPRPQ